MKIDSEDLKYSIGELIKQIPAKVSSDNIEVSEQMLKGMDIGLTLAIKLIEEIENIEMSGN